MKPKKSRGGCLNRQPDLVELLWNLVHSHTNHVQGSVLLLPLGRMYGTPCIVAPMVKAGKHVCPCVSDIQQEVQEEKSPHQAKEPSGSCRWGLLQVKAHAILLF